MDSMYPSHILIVEDTEDHADLIRRAFESWEPSVHLTVAATLQEARRRLEELTPDLIIADWLLPDGKGTELIRLVPEGREWPIVVMTGHGTAQLAVEVMKAGALDYVVKSVETLADMPHIAERAFREWELAAARTRAEEQVQESEKRLRALFEGIDDALFVWDEEGRLLDCNEVACQRLGYSRENVLEMDVAQIFNKGFAHEIREAVDWQAARWRYSSEDAYVTQDGRRIPVDVHTSLIEYQGRKALLSAARDISERKRAERALRESNEKFQIMFAESLDAILMVSGEEGQIVNANPAVRRDLGYAMEELAGKPFSVLYPPQSEVDLQRWKETLHVHGTVFDSQELLRADGTLCPMDLTATLIPWEEDQAILITLRDVSERQQAIKERSRLAAIVEQAAESIYITDLDGIIEYVNPSFERVSGYSREEVIGRKPSLLKSGKQDEAFYRDLWATIKRGEVWKGRLVNKRKDGTLIIEDESISPIRDSWGKVINYMAVKQDVTQQVDMEAQLRQARKMEAIGRLAGGIAHDFNNILFAIVGFTELAITHVPKDRQCHDHLQEVLKAARRASDLVRQILTFSRQTEQGRKPVQIQTVVIEALELMRSTLPSTIRIQEEIAPACGPVLADPTQIHQVIMNLCTNAYHAMRDYGGLLEVGMTELSITPEQAALYPEQLPGHYVRLWVHDTGHGMDKAILERIFEPYFTTKKPGEGTGLGLALVHGIVKSHGGTITVYSKLGEGSQFDIFFPRYAAEEGVVEDSSVERPLSGGQEHILLVDDEPQIAQVGKISLERLGYTVTAYTDSVEALQKFNEEPGYFDLVITDQTMPGLTGTELAQELLRTRPSLPVILCTGFSETVNEQQACAFGIQAYLRKPATQRDMAELVRRLLDAQEQER